MNLTGRYILIVLLIVPMCAYSCLGGTGWEMFSCFGFHRYADGLYGL